MNRATTSTQAARYHLSELIDLETYALDGPDTARYAEAVSRARSGLQSVGCAVITDFVRPDALAILSQEINERKPTTHYSTQMMNPYFHVSPNPDYPDRHPVNTFLERSSGFVPGDSWEQSTSTRYLFEHPAICRFLADCLEIPALHPYADPLAGLTANVLNPGQQFTWHFDTNEFAVTVLVDEADEGGRFEYVPNIRSNGDEGFDAIQVVLEGGRERVHTLDLRPGDLQIFRGRYSLHSVSRVAENSRPRHAAIFAYTEKPGVIGRLERTKQLFGRVLPEHIEAEEARVRSDGLID